MAKYGCQPFFKAGMHSGMVTVTEVGIYKKEIAYHEDTINTAARLQEQCNRLGQELILSKQLSDQLQYRTDQAIQLGKVSLKGKSGEMEICAVTRPGYPGKMVPIQNMLPSVANYEVMELARC